MKLFWKNVAGLLVYPHFKKSQKIRTNTSEYVLWIPDLEDTVTFYFFIGLLIEKGVEVKKEGKIYHIDGNKMTEDQLKNWIMSNQKSS